MDIKQRIKFHACVDSSGHDVGWALAHQIDGINADLQENQAISLIFPDLSA